ncbi:MULTISPECIES: hypothetical protein [Streptomyces]|uniref:hypothetical protein n=1 Tax=Streptomyces TaxID=1883 RepID=UPI0036CF4BA6
MGTKIGAIGIILSVPALVIGIYGLYVQSVGTQLEEKRQASRIDWYLSEDNLKILPDALIVENRSLNIAYGVLVTFKDLDSGRIYNYDFGLIPACSRETYPFSPHSSEVALAARDWSGYGDLYFTDGTTRYWKNGVFGASTVEDYNVPQGLDVIQSYRIQKKREELSSCS